MTITAYEPAPMPTGPNVPAWVATLEPAVRLAEVLAQTEFVPKAFRGRPESIAACVLYGAELGLGPMQSLSSIPVVEGRPSPSAELLRALIYAAGGEIWVEVATDTRVKVVGKRKGSANSTAVEWTTEHARRAGLAGKQNWRTYPRQMLTARATAELARLLWPDVVKGLWHDDDDDEQPPDLDAASPAPAGEPPSTNPTGSTMRRRRRTTPESAPAEASPLPRPAPEDAPAPVEDEAPPSHPRPVPVAPAPTTDDRPAERQHEPATDAQVQRLNIALREIVGGDREQKLDLVRAIIGRDIESSRDLTLDEASAAIDYADGIVAGTHPLPEPLDVAPDEPEPDDS